MNILALNTTNKSAEVAIKKETRVDSVKLESSHFGKFTAGNRDNADRKQPAVK